VEKNVQRNVRIKVEHTAKGVGVKNASVEKHAEQQNDQGRLVPHSVNYSVFRWKQFKHSG